MKRAHILIGSVVLVALMALGCEYLRGKESCKSQPQAAAEPQTSIEDFHEQAAGEITADNAEAELEKIIKEIEADEAAGE